MNAERSTYVRLEIERTFRLAGNGNDWYRGEGETQTFASLQEAKTYVNETYGTDHRRSTVYRDTPNGPKKTGFVVHYRDYENGRCYYGQDWIEFVSVSEYRSINATA